MTYFQHNCDADIRKFCAGKKDGAIECLSNMKIVRLLQPNCLKVYGSFWCLGLL